MKKLQPSQQKGDITLKILLLAFSVILLACASVFLPSVYEAKLEAAANYWESQGYVAYADAEGNLLPLSGDNTSDLGSSSVSWQDFYADGNLYLKGSDNYSSFASTATFIVGQNTANDDVPGSSGCWVRDGRSGEVIRLTIDNYADDDFNYVDSIASNGDTIAVIGANFTVDNKITVTKNITLDLGSSIITANTNLNDTVIEVSGVDDARILNGVIDGNKANQSGTCYGIYIVGSTYVQVMGVHLHDVNGYAIRGTNSSRLIITNNFVRNIGTIGGGDGAHDGIGLYKTTTDTGRSIIANNEIEAVEDEGISVDDGTHRILITNNYVEGSRYGIGVNNHAAGAMPGGALSDVDVAGNIVIGSTRGGIQVSGNPEGLGVLTRIRVLDNHVDQSAAGYSGISVTGWVEKVDIIGNSLDTIAGGGIECYGLTEGATTKYPSINIIADNYIARTGTPDRKGIYVQGTVQKVTNNRVVDWNGNSSDAIAIVGISGSEIQYAQITGNQAYVSSGAGTSPIRFYYVQHSIVSGNIVRGRATGGAYGILEGTGCDYNYITNNDVSGISDATKFVKTGANTIVKENQGYVTENSGTVTINNGDTVAEVTHGLSITPDEEKIRLTPLEVPTNAPIMLTVAANATSTKFWIVASGDPGASNQDIGWSYAQ